MKINKIKQAKEEALRFLDRADKVIKGEKKDPHFLTNSSKAAASLKRQSLELSNSLSDMRNK
jgi:hypothetical protein